MQLREYQYNAVDKLRSNMKNGVQSQLLCVPTGGGKTVIASYIIQSAAEKGKKILFLAHRRELINQCVNKLSDFGVRDFSVIMSGDKRFNDQASVTVASIQTLIKREFPPADLIIIDEAHRAASKSYLNVLANYPNAKVLGLSATPERLDGKGLDDLFDELIEVTTVSKLIEEGFLVSPIVYSGRLDKSALKGVKKVKGDYSEHELQQAMDKPKLIGDIVENWKLRANGMQTVVFASGVEHSKHIAKAFFDAGIPTASADGSMSISERESIIRDWRSGFLKVVVNCMLFTEGFDYPELACCVIARPTQSIALALQMMGRIMRTSEVKPVSMILDHAGIMDEHGSPTIDRAWTLEGAQARKKNEVVQTMDTCSCGMVYISNPKWWIVFNKINLPLSVCPSCLVSVCKVCHHDVKLIAKTVSIDGVATQKQADCPKCNALYTDDKAHLVSEQGQDAVLPENTTDLLQLYATNTIPLSVMVKEKFKNYLIEAKKSHKKRGWIYHRLMDDFKEYEKSEINSHIPRHTASWWRQEA